VCWGVFNMWHWVYFCTGIHLGFNIILGWRYFGLYGKKWEAYIGCFVFVYYIGREITPILH
jgi:hypothetical protein